MLGVGNNKVAINIMGRAKFSQISQENSVVYYEYTVKDTETPEIVAFNYYNDSALHWIILYAFDATKSRRICGWFLGRSIGIRRISMQSVGGVG